MIWIATALVVAWARGLALRLVAAVAVAVWSADLLVLGIKQVVDRSRPFEALPDVERLMGALGSSFPSGHAATSAAGLVVLCAAAPKLAPAFVTLALAIGFSRVYVGVHYLSDVLVGAGIGALVGLPVLLVRPLRWQGPGRRRRRRDRLRD